MPSRIAVCYCRALRCCRDFYYFRPGLHFATGILTISGWVFVLLHVLFVYERHCLNYNNFCNIRRTRSTIVKIFVTDAKLTPFLWKSLLQIRYWPFSCENLCCKPAAECFPVKIFFLSLFRADTGFISVRFRIRVTADAAPTSAMDAYAVLFRSNCSYLMMTAYFAYIQIRSQNCTDILRICNKPLPAAHDQQDRTIFSAFFRVISLPVLHIHVHSVFLQNLCTELWGIGCMCKNAVQNA